MVWTSRNLDNISYLNYMIKKFNTAENAITKNNESPFILEHIIYDFEEYLQYNGLYINQRKIARRYLRRCIQILKKYMPKNLSLKPIYLDYLL